MTISAIRSGSMPLRRRTGKALGDTCALIERALDERLDAENVSVSVSAHGVSAGATSFSATLSICAHVVRSGVEVEVMGVALPKLSLYRGELVVDCYKPGVLLSGGRGYAACGGDPGGKTVGACRARRSCGRGLSARRSSWPRESCFAGRRRRASPGGMAGGVRVGSLAGFDAVMGGVDDGLFLLAPRMSPRRSGTSCFRWRGSGLRCDVGSHLVGFEHAGSAPDARGGAQGCA